MRLETEMLFNGIYFLIKFCSESGDTHYKPAANEREPMMIDGARQCPTKAYCFVLFVFMYSFS